MSNFIIYLVFGKGRGEITKIETGTMQVPPPFFPVLVIEPRALYMLATHLSHPFSLFFFVCLFSILFLRDGLANFARLASNL
jgi:hypothetical protein